MSKEDLYKKFARYYDKIYSKKDYVGECKFIEWALRKHKASAGNNLLDIACGTGSHANILKRNFSILGVDINEEMLKIAGKKVPEAEFILGNMKELNLDKKFDVITCLFSAMNYNLDLEEFEATLNNFYQHLNKDGVLIFDLGINQENWIEGMVSVDTVVENDLKLARICQSHLEGSIFNANFVFLIKEEDKFDFDIDSHVIGVFKTIAILELMENVGYDVFIYGDFTPNKWVPNSMERPVFVGIKI
ncbi:MAG: class I SAM-dependent DNA methyltransferase [Methanomicrobiales archaeon]